MGAVIKHELYMYYHSLTAYVFGAFILVFTGIGAMLYNINASVANFEYVLGFISIIFVIIVPLLTMRVISEERRQKTDQLLYSLPITSTDIVVGKFLALMVVYLIPLIIIGFYPLLFSRFGDVYLPTSYGCLFAFFLMGLALISMGMFVSSATESQGMAAGICVVVMLFNYYCSNLADYVSSSSIGALIGLVVVCLLVGWIIKFMTKSVFAGMIVSAIGIIASVITFFVSEETFDGLLPAIMQKLSLFERFQTFTSGIFDLTGIVYYLSVVVFFLFLCVQSFEKRRYNG